MVKSAVSDDSVPEENEVNVDIPVDLHVKEEGEESLIPPKPSEDAISESPVSTIPEPPKTMPSGESKKSLELTPSVMSTPVKSVTQPHEPIFVRIDKFQESQKNFDQIREGVKEIESDLRKVKDVKAKEEEELAAWTQDLEKIKSRLAEVDSNIFDQI